MTEPAADDLILASARRLRRQLTDPPPDEIVLFMTISGVALTMLLMKYELPVEAKSVHKYHRHLETEFQRLDEVKTAIEDGCKPVGDNWIDSYIQLYGPYYPKACDELDRVACVTLIMTAFTKWIFEEQPQLDSESIFHFIREFFLLFFEQVGQFSAGLEEMVVN